MRLLVLTPEFDDVGGGIATFYRALCPALKDRGFDIRVIEGSAFHASEDRAPRNVDGVSVETLELRRLKTWWNRFTAFEAVPELRRHMAAAWAMWEQAEHGEAADIVEACDWGLLGVPPAIEGCKPLIVQCHGSVGQIAFHDPMAGEEVQSALVRLIERAIFTTVNLQTSSRSNAAFWSGETGRDVEIIKPALRPQSTGPQSAGRRGLVVGRVQKWKGPQTLCEALQLLGGRAPDVEWVGRDTVWGARESVSSTHLLRTYPGIWAKKVVHFDRKTADEVRRRQSSALFNLVCSTWDVFNFTAIEAMASGRPTIVSDGAGASDLIEDGVNGFVFRSGDANALAAAIDRLLAQNPARLLEMGRAAQVSVRTSCDPQLIARQRDTTYRSTIANSLPSRQSKPVGWLADICEPKEMSHSLELAFLDQQPLRSIAAAVLRRAQAKAFSWLTAR